MPDYQAIYNHIVQSDPRYNLAENSPGLRAVIQATEQIKMISGRSFDLGCGVGFVVQYLSGSSFDLMSFGADISDLAIEAARSRMNPVVGSAQRLVVLKSQTIPFEDSFFSLITCFDMLEHLDEEDIETSWNEIQRVLRPGGTFFGSVSCRKSGAVDLFGDNLHRTVRSVDWWLDRIQPDQAEWDASRSQLKIWKRKPLVKVRVEGSTTPQPVIRNSPNPMDTRKDANRPTLIQPTDPVSNSGQPDFHHGDTSALYQKIYDENPWYGDASQGRCPGVRLLPQYAHWLIGPVMDLGCGRGQTVENLRKLGFAAEGIDQIRIHSEMRVGDITQPIADMEDFNSVVCIDCIEHLFPDQVERLFANMKRVQRQAFSIHNGESKGTGQELHVNRLEFPQWEALIEKHFRIESAIVVTPDQRLYLTESIQ